ncbi:MAG: DciA family protein [Cyanobacteria bacterium J06623_7]
MQFNSIDQILTQLENQPGWEKFRQHRQLLTCWERVVSKQMAAQTRPQYINRQVLYVATSSAARAQELSFQRYTLLKRLNQQLPFKLKDIRFSAAAWQQKTYQQPERPTIFTISDRHKSPVTPVSSKISPQQPPDKQNEADSLSPQAKAKAAVQRWLKTVEQRSLTIPTCPKCNSATARSELARWNLCHHCVAQEWSSKYRVPDFTKPE